jgi:hypothetical protein
VVAFEVKSGRSGRSPGLDAFRKRHPRIPTRVIGTGGIPLEEFFSAPPQAWL